MTILESKRVAVLAFLALASCSLALDWDPAGLPCDEQNNKECAEGYSCLVNRCVEEGSLPLTTTCSLPEQCEGYPDVTCGSNPFTCRHLCTELYDATDICQADEYCRPERSRDFDDQWVGTCFPSECLRDDDCRSDRVCVPITGSAGACLVSCTYDFTTGSYDDTCGSSLETDQYCQPVGRQGEQELVCLEAIAGRQGIGLPCDAVDTPCERGVACVDGVCRQYCTTVPADNCPAGTHYCQRINNDGAVPLYSVCFEVP